MESLADRRWTKKLIFLQKIILGLLPSDLKDYLLPCDNLKTYLTRSSIKKTIKTFPAKTLNQILNHPSFQTVLKNGEILVRNLEI